MKRYRVKLLDEVIMQAEVTIEADSPQAAIAEAHRLAEKDELEWENTHESDKEVYVASIQEVGNGLH